jgi:hypothetical protein
LMGKKTLHEAPGIFSSLLFRIVGDCRVERLDIFAFVNLIVHVCFCFIF